MTYHLALRVIDANLNRAREALRVMEEHARLVLGDPLLTTDLKSLRHDIARAVPPHLFNRLLAARDIVGDVGTTISTPAERHRAGAADVVVAATRRLGESLRVIEEHAKIIDAEFAGHIEAVRYRGYDLECRLLLRAHARDRFGGVRLYVLMTEALCPPADRPDAWLDVAERAIRGGADCLQLREPRMDGRTLLARSRALAVLCRRLGAISIVNDRPDLAALSGADGVHLGQDDLGVADARRLMGPEAVVGLSTHDVDQAIAAARAAPDYVAVGPMFDSSTKPQLRIAGTETLRKVRALTTLPLVAIGGIDADRAADVLDAGADSLCVCASVIGAADPEGEARRLRAIIDDHRETHATADA